MAEFSKFFNSAPDDRRKYQASDFANYFSNVLSTGLLHTNESPGMQVSVGAGLKTIVSPGKAVMDGYAYENTTPLMLEHNLPESDLDRIDRIVLRLDKRNQSRYIKLFVITGDSSVEPVAPELTRDEFVYELSLAQIRVRANTSSLNAADLIDERLNEDLCGLVSSLITVPTSQFLEQWNTFFDNIKNETMFTKEQYEQAWEEWFEQQQTEGFVMQDDFDELIQPVKEELEEASIIVNGGLKLSDGVFPGGLIVRFGTASFVEVTPGMAIIGGIPYYHESGSVSGDVTGVQSGSMYRYVLQLDLVNGNIQVVKKEAYNELPALIRNNLIYELSIATVGPDPDPFMAYRVTDTRHDETVCGFVRPLNMDLQDSPELPPGGGLG